MAIRIFSGSLYGPMVGVVLSQERSDTNLTRSSLAGMIHKTGVLTRDNWWQVPFAYKMYTRTDDDSWIQSNLFKKTFSVPVKIKFLGVWCVNTVHVLFVASVDAHVGIQSAQWVGYPKSCLSQPLTPASPTFDTLSLSMNIALNSTPTYTTGPMRMTVILEPSRMTRRLSNHLRATSTVAAPQRMAHPMKTASSTTQNQKTSLMLRRSGSLYVSSPYSQPRPKYSALGMPRRLV